jgi:chromosome segregation ATPase
MGDCRASDSAVVASSFRGTNCFICEGCEQLWGDWDGARRANEILRHNVREYLERAEKAESERDALQARLKAVQTRSHAAQLEAKNATAHLQQMEQGMAQMLAVAKHNEDRANKAERDLAQVRALNQKLVADRRRARDHMDKQHQVVMEQQNRLVRADVAQIALVKRLSEFQQTAK